MIGFRHIPIRLRLSLWYMVLTALVLVIFSIAIYIGLERRLSATMDEDLSSQASLAAASITYGGGGAILDTAYRSRLSDEALLWVVDFDNKPVLKIRGEQLANFTPPKNDVAGAANGVTSYNTVKLGGQELRLITVPVRDENGKLWLALQLGYPTSRIKDALDLLVQTLLVVASIAILVAAATGYLLAGRALQPVSDITRLASRIDGNDLDARLNLDLPNDELGRLASTFDSMLARIDLAFQRQRQFTGDAAHELRTPLSLMRSQIDLALTQAETTAEYQEALTALDGDVSRMTTLVGMLLSLARADAGQLTPNREPVDLADLAQDVADQLEPIAAESGLSIATDLRPVVATVDADMFIQVLVNLIDNAIANTPSGGTITVKVDSTSDLKLQSPNGGTPASQHIAIDNSRLTSAVVTVSDTGIGISPNHLPRIFDRFYRVDTGRARSHGGIGLGLAICEAIVHAHHGTLTATSQPGRGSTFTMTVPVDSGDPGPGHSGNSARGLVQTSDALRLRP